MIAQHFVLSPIGNKKKTTESKSLQWLMVEKKYRSVSAVICTSVYSHVIAIKMHQLTATHN